MTDRPRGGRAWRLDFAGAGGHDDGCPPLRSHGPGGSCDLASLVGKKCGTGRKKTPLMQKNNHLTPFAHVGFEPVISGLSLPFAFNTKTFGKRVPQSPFQDGIFITRSPPESASRNGTRRIFAMRRKNLPLRICE